MIKQKKKENARKVIYLCRSIFEGIRRKKRAQKAYSKYARRRPHETPAKPRHPSLAFAASLETASETSVLSRFSSHLPACVPKSLPAVSLEERTLRNQDRSATDARSAHPSPSLPPLPRPLLLRQREAQTLTTWRPTLKRKRDPGMVHPAWATLDPFVRR